MHERQEPGACAPKATVDECGKAATERPDPDVVAERVQDETVLVHLQTNRIYALNRTARRAWELLAEGWARPAIQRQLLEEYDVSNEQLDAELGSLFSSLHSEGLIRSGNS